MTGEEKQAHQKRVVGAVQKHLGEGAEEGMPKFRNLTLQYGKGHISAPELRDELQQLLGEVFTAKLLPELCKILPGEDKRAALAQLLG